MARFLITSWVKVRFWSILQLFQYCIQLPYFGPLIYRTGCTVKFIIQGQQYCTREVQSLTKLAQYHTQFPSSFHLIPVWASRSAPGLHMHVAMCKDSVSVARPIETSFATATASPTSAAANTTVIATTFSTIATFLYPCYISYFYNYYCQCYTAIATATTTAYWFNKA